MGLAVPSDSGRWEVNPFGRRHLGWRLCHFRCCVFVMDFQLRGLLLPVPSLGDGCVTMPLAVAAAAPAAAELLLLPSSWWLLPWLLNRFSRHFFF